MVAGRHRRPGDRGRDRDARTVLAGIDDGDPAVLDGLPRISTESTDVLRQVWLAVGTEVASWDQMPAGQREDLTDNYRNGFNLATEDRVAALCRAAIRATCDSRDLSHLHPDRLRIGSVGVFTCEWLMPDHDDDGGGRVSVGFVGTVLDLWCADAVFSCTRVVAEAIVAVHQERRAQDRANLLASGVAEPELDRLVDNDWANLFFDGDTIVADERGIHDDPDEIERIEPDVDGQYVVTVWNCFWVPVDPHRCDRIVGELPAPGGQQAFVTLTHTRQLRLPHDRLRVDLPGHRHSRALDWCFATLTLDERPVGVAHHHGDLIEVDLTVRSFGPGAWQRYLDRCRDDGKPATRQRVLEALVTEQLLDAQLADSRPDTAWVRLVDADDRTVDLYRVSPAPDTHQGWCVLGGQLAPVDGPRWQFWDSPGWRDVPRPYRVTAPDNIRDHRKGR